MVGIRCAVLDARGNRLQNFKNGIRKSIATSNIKASCKPGLEINGAFYSHGFPVIGRLSESAARFWMSEDCTPSDAGIIIELWQLFLCIGWGLIATSLLSTLEVTGRFWMSDFDDSVSR
nr:uncharacterized protein LOC126525893 isoform X4 [Dermacentor andersoni]XP_054923909.1 uncharacterized protein LOC126525893 isoform X4 [Dermacentor andersoni]